MVGTQTLTAGPVRLQLGTEGDVRHIRLGGDEIVERIYMAVRDRNWSTIPARLDNLTVRQNDRSFAVSYDASHVEGDVDFRWHATISGDDHGRITFTLDGQAHSTFLRNRIGFCVHHPLICAGKPVIVRKADGSEERSAFPALISPHQPFLEMRSITHEVRPNVRAEVRFTGEIFETEDHRNWTDANFKTYGTPLRIPYPVEVKAGTKITQIVEVIPHGQTSGEAQPSSGPVRILAKGRVSKLPAIGLDSSTADHAMTETEVAAIRRLNLAHLRVDSKSAEGWNRGLAEAKRLGLKVEAAVTWPAPAEELKKAAPVVERWLVYDAKKKAADSEAVRQVREVIGPDAALVAGTDSYFAELNRNRPAGFAIQGACFSVNPQVHAFDDESVMNNTSAQRDVVETAKSFLGDLPVVVSAVTLRMRFNADATVPTPPPPPDPRQKMQICAAWTVASLKQLSEAGAASVTYFETHGPRGLLEGETRFPVYAVFEAIAGFMRADVVKTKTSDDSKVATLLLALGTKRRMLIANKTASPIEVTIEAAEKRLTLPAYAVEVLDWSE
jgi:hypothetical protein